MPIFKMTDSKAKQLKLLDFKNEKDLQGFIEKNLEEIFNCRFIATEFYTGAQHSGRIDTLALSEENNPVIIEYKVVESSDLINQSLFYLSWINDHKGDFKVAAEAKLGKKVEIDWSEIRVICIAPGYRKYDLHAVKMMGTDIELWEYRVFEDGVLMLEEVFRKTTAYAEAVKPLKNGKNPVMVAAGKKAAKAKFTGVYKVEEHLKKGTPKINAIAEKIREQILEISDSIEEVPKKLYIAYKVAKNFLCMEIQKKKIYLFLKLNPADYKNVSPNIRDVRKIGHFGTGDLEYTLKDEKDIEEAKRLIVEAYKNTGG